MAFKSLTEYLVYQALMDDDTLTDEQRAKKLEDIMERIEEGKEKE
jgi:hypothetical protein